MFSLRVPKIFQTTDNIAYNTTALTRVCWIGEVSDA